MHIQHLKTWTSRSSSENGDWESSSNAHSRIDGIRDGDKHEQRNLASSMPRKLQLPALSIVDSGEDIRLGVSQVYGAAAVNDAAMVRMQQPRSPGFLCASWGIVGRLSPILPIIASAMRIAGLKLKVWDTGSTRCYVVVVRWDG
jgi:hypothetical protein